MVTAKNKHTKTFRGILIQFTHSLTPAAVVVHALHEHIHAALAAHTAQHLPMSTISQLFYFREENFSGWKSNVKIQKKHCAMKSWSCTVAVIPPVYMCIDQVE